MAPDNFGLPEWEALAAEAARLGVAVARFENALDDYRRARDALAAAS